MDCLLKKIHLLIHADDANILAPSRQLMLAKVRSMLQYCKVNKIQLQLSKCMFIVINGSAEDRNEVAFDAGKILHTDELMILGSPISSTGKLKQDLKLHLEKRFKNCIKYFNFVRSNKVAPISVKLKVLTACVTSTLLYNCETFGNDLPKGLESLYFKLIKCALNVRPNIPNEIVLVESGLLPLRALVLKRQLKFYRRYKASLKEVSVRQSVFNDLLSPINRTSYMQHYVTLDEKYANPKDIYTEAMANIKTRIQEKSCPVNHYRYYIYSCINPDLLPSPFLNCANGADPITRFRLGSHNLPIETGRWSRIPRENRLCSRCNVMGDEYHFVFHCSEITRDPGYEFVENLGEIWKNENIFNLFKQLSQSDFLKN